MLRRGAGVLHVGQVTLGGSRDEPIAPVHCCEFYLIADRVSVQLMHARQLAPTRDCSAQVQTA